MSDLSRRAFLRRSAGVAAGAAAVAATGLPQVARAAGASAEEPDASGADLSGDAVVAYVRADASEVTLMVGEREVVTKDRDLVRRIRHAAR
jgi:hypothetical protein